MLSLDQTFSEEGINSALWSDLPLDNMASVHGLAMYCPYFEVFFSERHVVAKHPF